MAHCKLLMTALIETLTLNTERYLETIFLYAPDGK